MLAGADVAEELLRGIQFCSLTPYRLEPAVDHSITPPFVTVKHLTDLGQAQTNCLAGLHDAQPAKVFLGIVAVP